MYYFEYSNRNGGDRMIWRFVINNKFYSELKKQDKIKWNSPKDVRKGDLIAVYTSRP